MEGKDELAQTHLDALPVLLSPMIKAKEARKGLSYIDVVRTLADWDKARKTKGEL